jgi:hypothetical protein
MSRQGLLYIDYGCPERSYAQLKKATTTLIKQFNFLPLSQLEIDQAVVDLNRAVLFCASVSLSRRWFMLEFPRWLNNTIGPLL